MQRITISDGASFEEFRPNRRRGQRQRGEDVPEVHATPPSSRYRAVERDEPFLMEKKAKHEPIMSRPDYELMTDDEAQVKRIVSERVEAPHTGPAPIPEQEDVVANEDELPEEIDESDIPDMDVPEEEKPAPLPPEVKKPEVVKEQPKRKELRKARKEQRKVRRSPAHEQLFGAPFLSQATVEADNKVPIKGILIAIGLIAVVGGIVYFLKRGK